MTPEIRLLDAQKDLAVHEEAWKWREAAPRWFQESLDIFKEDWNEYLVAIPGELHYGVFVNHSPTAIIRLIEAFPWVFQIHLSAKRKTDFGLLLQSGLSIRDYLFGTGVKAFFGYIPVVHRGIIKLYEGLGFQDSGIRCYKGQIRGRVCEMQQMICRNDNIKISHALPQ